MMESCFFELTGPAKSTTLILTLVITMIKNINIYYLTTISIDIIDISWILLCRQDPLEQGEQFYYWGLVALFEFVHSMPADIMC